MKIFKFGGASVQDVDHIKHVARIIEQYKDEKLLIVVSAMGKTTNALEKVAEAFYEGRKDDALRLFSEIKKQHITIAKYLLVLTFNDCIARMADLFTEIEWLLHDKPVREYNYYYDQIVSIGELLSTSIVSAYLNEVKIDNAWIDVRDILRTDNHFREAIVDWEYTSKTAETLMLPLFDQHPILLTQGFIGCTSDNESTTLGREGSDFSAAIFANIFNAENLTIWKDVEGVMNADPKIFPEAVYISHLNYEEVIEMAYYGAQVIHPKTIKPLQNKNIPLHVKCFLDTALPGTVIDNQKPASLPPVIILKSNQALLSLQTHDFSFIEEEPIRRLYKIFNKKKIKPNLILTGAIGLQIVVDDIPEKIEAFGAEASETFELNVTKGFHLLTIRHYNDEALEKYLSGKRKFLVQQDQTTLQALYY
ncbi:MAG: aspartate kinase [Arachidicoccus sp.]|nr:aspartate kinase [Arachidicoccus sp.]